MKRWTVGLLVTIMLAGLALAGCGQKQAPKEGIKASVLRVGTEATFAPFEFQDDQGKEYAGFDMDIVRAIGKQMGMEVQIQNIGFDGLIPALEAGNIDLVASAMTITEERKQKVAFSQGYYQSGLSIVVKADNTAIKGFKDLEGKKVAVQIGTTGAEEARKIKDTKVKEFNTMPEAFIELNNAGVDAVVNDLPVNQYYIQKSGAKNAKLLSEKLNSEEYGLAVSKKNTELAGKVNKALEELKKNGEYDQIYMKWFGSMPGK